MAKSAASAVDGFIRKNTRWQKELTELRRIVLGCDVVEDVKWRTPCYTYDGTNLVMLGAMKEYCALSFLKGSLLKDPKSLLIQPGQNTQSARYIRFTDIREILDLEPTLKAYIEEAIAAEKAGLKVYFKKTSEFPVPDELARKLKVDPRFKNAFESLTPGRQRAYLLFFGGAKQSKTRESRILKHEQRILDGKGIDDD